MWSTTLTLQPTMVAAKQLIRAACCDICRPAHEKGEAEFRPLRMNWAVVTDTNGNRRLQMRWQIS